MKNTDIKRVFVIVLSAILVSMNMSMVTYAKENDMFATSAYANHWGRSDLRAYLNGVEKTNRTLPYDTTHNSRIASGYYESQFSDAEYALVQPHTYNTNDFYSSGDGTKTYTTTDKFWLPSGNYNSDQVISWGKNDISSGSPSESIEINRVIPISYWSCSSRGSWLRSAYDVYNSHALVAMRGTYLTNGYVDRSYTDVAPMFKINLSSINFASVASAASIIHSSDNSGANKIDISGSSLFGQITPTALPDYGMYLKSVSNDSFITNSLQYDANYKQITVGYSGAVADQYVVIQAYKEDNLEAGTTSYVAARKLEGNQTSLTIDVSNWRLSSLDGYNIKVWMEDGSGSLAKATTPETFVGSDGSMTNATTNEIINNRVFAMKSNLQTSWGTLLDVDALVGSNPTNQKIYFGKDSYGRPLEFWIAGRENSNGTIASNGEIMYLYQVKATETREFNKSSNINISISDNISETYNANPHTCNVTSITVNGEDKLSEIKGLLNWEYRKTGTQEWIEGNPVNAGDYEIRCYYEISNEKIYSNISKLLIGKKPLEYTKTLDEIDALTGNKLSELDVDSMLEKPTSMDGNEEILGLWTFVNPDTVIDRTGKQTQKVVFTPSDDNYEKLEIDITLNVIDNTTLWGEEVTRQDGVTQYVDTNGKTSVKVSRESLDNNGIIWLKEESDGTSIWYGIDASDGTFELDRHLRFYAKWISPVEDSHNNLYDLIDEKTKSSMEKDKSHIFQIGVEDVNGNKVNPSGAIKVYVELEDNWNTNDVKACFIANGNDENIPVAIEKKNSLVSNHSYAIMTLEHFSPYLIYDQITDEEKEALNKPTDSGMDNSDSIDGESNINNINKKDNVVDKEIKGTVTSANIGEDNRETSELYKTPNTGDMNNNYWFVIMIISGLGIICVNGCIKMKKSEK